MRIEMKPKQQTVSSNGGKISSVNCGSVTFVSHDPLFEETVLDTACKAM